MSRCLPLEQVSVVDVEVIVLELVSAGSWCRCTQKLEPVSVEVDVNALSCLELSIRRGWCRGVVLELVSVEADVEVPVPEPVSVEVDVEYPAELSASVCH
jgi:hypothetical protein